LAIAPATCQRVLLSLALVVRCGFLMGFCFPVGLRWLTQLKQEETIFPGCGRSMVPHRASAVLWRS
jgi:hypothetical protein